jgi:hypothetical protein
MRLAAFVCLFALALGGCGGTETSSIGSVMDSGTKADGTAARDASGDASLETTVLSDVASEASSCRSGEILVVSTGCRNNVSCHGEDGAPFECPAGSREVNVGPCCCQQSSCKALPADCDGTLSCDCARSLCPSGYECGVEPMNPDTLSCGFFPP